jgi:hypothetical protein
MVVFRDYHTEVINALPPLCLALAYALWDHQPGAAVYAAQEATPVDGTLDGTESDSARLNRQQSTCAAMAPRCQVAPRSYASPTFGSTLDG